MAGKTEMQKTEMQLRENEKTFLSPDKKEIFSPCPSSERNVDSLISFILPDNIRISKANKILLYDSGLLKEEKKFSKIINLLIVVGFSEILEKEKYPSLWESAKNQERIFLLSLEEEKRRLKKKEMYFPLRVLADLRKALKNRIPKEDILSLIESYVSECSFYSNENKSVSRFKASLVRMGKEIRNSKKKFDLLKEISLMEIEKINVMGENKNATDK